MRDVRTSRDRGQIILVGALALAVVLVGIALVLNASIYAENLATRANQQETAEVVALEQEAKRGAGVAMNHLHHDASAHATYSDLESGLKTGINGWSSITVRDMAREGQYVDVEYTGTHTKGTRVAHDDGTAFEPQDPSMVGTDGFFSGVTYWRTARDVDRMRDFTMTVDRSELREFTESDAEDYVRSILSSGTFTSPPFAVAYDVNDADSSDIDHVFAIYRPDDGDPDNVKISYYSEDLDRVTTCEIPDAESSFEVDISGARVEGGDGRCNEVLSFSSEISAPYQMFYVQGSWIKGDYEFIVNQDLPTFRANIDGLIADFQYYYEDHTDGHTTSYSPSSPFVEPAIYSAEVGIDYRSDSASYESTVTVAPNEP